MKRNKKPIPFEVEKLKARNAGIAATTRGRKTRFKNHKREASKKACRGKSHE